MYCAPPPPPLSLIPGLLLSCCSLWPQIFFEVYTLRCSNCLKCNDNIKEIVCRNSSSILVGHCWSITRCYESVREILCHYTPTRAGCRRGELSWLLEGGLVRCSVSWVSPYHYRYSMYLLCMCSQACIMVKRAGYSMFTLVFATPVYM